MTDIIVTGIILAIIFAACVYIRKEKKKGRKCIGCPHSSCPSQNSLGSCSQSDK